MATYTWLASGGGDFSVASNWTLDGIDPAPTAPGPNDIADFNSATTGTISGNADVMLDPERAEFRQVLIELAEARLARRRAAQAEARARAEAEAALKHAAARSEEALTLAQQLDLVRHSTTWRLAWPLRAIGSRIPPRFHATARRTVHRLLALIEPRPHDESFTSVAPEPTHCPAPQDSGRRIQRLLFVSGEPQTPGNLFRCVLPVEAAKAIGLAAAWLPSGELTEAAFGGVDLLLLWRTPMDARLAALLSAAKAADVRIVFDIDDLLVDPELARPSIIDGVRTSASSVVAARELSSRLQQTLLAAEACTCTTEPLAQHLREWQKPTYVLPVVFNEQMHGAARRALRARRQAGSDGLIRIGYQAGSRTHQRDFQGAVGALARVLRERPATRLVLPSDAGRGVILIEEFPELKALSDRVEWRNLVPYSMLPNEYARFDINIAPLELGNVFCAAKSPVKYIEAALVNVCTVASPTPAFVGAIEDGTTGFLVGTSEDWYRALLRLVDDGDLRERIGRAAYHDVLWRCGPHRCREALASLVQQLEGGAAGARAFELGLRRGADAASRPPTNPPSTVVFASDQLGEAEVTVLLLVSRGSLPLLEALEAIYAQTADPLDLVIIHHSDDVALALVTQWAQRNWARFNRLLVQRQGSAMGRGGALNSGFDASETLFIFPIDSEELLLPACVATFSAALRHSGSAYSYAAAKDAGLPIADQQGGAYQLIRYASRDFCGPMALIAKWAWVAAGGFNVLSDGSVEFDFWCRLAELGLSGKPVLGDFIDPRDGTSIGAEDKPLFGALDERVIKHHPWLQSFDRMPRAKAAKDPIPE